MATSPTRSPAPPAWWTGTVALPAHGSPATPLRYAVAAVEGDARLGCVWIIDRDTQKRQAVLWPDGYRAAFAPLRVFDPQGKIVWREGAWHQIGGGPSEVFVERIPAACRTGELAWWLRGPGEPYESPTPPGP